MFCFHISFRLLEKLVTRMYQWAYIMIMRNGESLIIKVTRENWIEIELVDSNRLSQILVNGSTIWITLSKDHLFQVKAQRIALILFISLLFLTFSSLFAQFVMEASLWLQGIRLPNKNPKFGKESDCQTKTQRLGKTWRYFISWRQYRRGSFCRTNLGCIAV